MMMLHCYECEKTWCGNYQLKGEVYLLCEKCLEKIQLSLDK